ncbi:hypothetical protein D3C71_948730 [compost metagenome]
MRFGLPDQRMLELDLCVDMGQARLGGADIGLGLRKFGAVVAVIDSKQHITGTHGLVVPDLDRRDIAGDLGGQRGDVPADIRVVGRGHAT